ncbi:hypothetical protein NKJ87_31950 [Mesorhizobium sp. M0027]|uniref:hypothetical protein n=1 Tax=Mesorhizobium sp. M0027 TaxID=2956848 RepID=UPI00333BE10D
MIVCKLSSGPLEVDQLAAALDRHHVQASPGRCAVRGYPGTSVDKEPPERFVMAVTAWKKVLHVSQKNLVIARDNISSGIRERAAELNLAAVGKISVVARDDDAVSDLARRASAAFRCGMVTGAIMAAE